MAPARCPRHVAAAPLALAAVAAAALPRCLAIRTALFTLEGLAEERRGLQRGDAAGGAALAAGASNATDGREALASEAAMVGGLGPMLSLGAWLLNTHSDVSNIQEFYGAFSRSAEALSHREGALGSEWEQLTQGAHVTKEDLRKLSVDPSQAKELMLSLTGVLIEKVQLQEQCFHNWFRRTRNWAKHFFGEDPVDTAYRASINKVRGEIETTLASTVKTISQVADLVTGIVLHTVCDFLAAALEGISDEARHTLCDKDHRDLRATIQALERPHAEGSMELLADLGLGADAIDHALFRWLEPLPPGARLQRKGRLPTLETMRRLVGASDQRRELARRIVGFTSVLQAVMIAAQKSKNTRVTHFLADLRDKSWGCGQKTSDETVCKEKKLKVNVPGDNLNSTTSTVTRVLGSRFATSLLLFWADAEAYERHEKCKIGHWMCDRTGYPGGLGRLALEPNTEELADRLYYWDPHVNILQWVQEMCEHHKFRSGRNCMEFKNMLSDMSAMFHLGTALTAGSLYLGSTVSAGGWAAVSGAGLLAALPHSVGGVVAAVTALFGTGVGPVVVAGLTIGGLLGSATWLMYRFMGLGAVALSNEDCMCGMLSSVTRPVMERGLVVPDQFLPRRADIGIGYDLCTSGLGACHTDAIFQARKDSEVPIESIMELTANFDCGSSPECVEEASDSWCRWVEVVRRTKKLCREGQSCDGLVALPGHPDKQVNGNKLFNELCEGFHARGRHLFDEARKAFAKRHLPFPPSACPIDVDKEA